MTTVRHIVHLLNAYGQCDDDRFEVIVEAMAADAGQAGKGGVKDRLLVALEQAKKNRVKAAWKGGRVPVPRAPNGNELTGIVLATRSRTTFDDLFLPEETADRLKEVVAENLRKDDLLSADVAPTRKVLLAGPPGTGKTMTAAVVANALDVPLYTVLLDGIVTKFMGETAAKLRLVFDAMVSCPGVWFFDEIDALAGSRDGNNDIGEARRIVNSLLTFIAEDASDSLIFGATNHPAIVDRAMFRRFDDILHFDLPSPDQVETLLRRRLAKVQAPGVDWPTVVGTCEGMSPADVVAAADKAIRKAVLTECGVTTTDALLRCVQDRRKGVEKIFAKP